MSSFFPGFGTSSSSSGILYLNYTLVTHSESPYTTLSTDSFIGVDSSGGTVSILLPNAPTTGRVYVIKDAFGSAYTHNITVTTVGGTVLIDSLTTYVLNTAYEGAQFLFNGTEYLIF